MKKILVLILSIILCLSFAGCGEDNSENPASTDSTTDTIIAPTDNSFSDQNTDNKENVTEQENENTGNSGNNDAANTGTEKPTNTDAPHTHKYGEWKVIKNADCTNDGEKERKCSCGETETEIIQATDHKVTTKKGTPATCTESGTTDGSYCSVCEIEFTSQEEIEALGHTTDAGVCSRCNEEYYSPYQKALKEENERYEKVLKNLASSEASIEAKRNILENTMYSLGIYSLQSPSYYSNRISSLNSSISSKTTQMYYAQQAGNYSLASQLSSEISDLQSDLTYYNKCLSLANDESNIEMLEANLTRAISQAKYEHESNISAIKKEYNQ
jgi:hypothetical protein